MAEDGFGEAPLINEMVESWAVSDPTYEALEALHSPQRKHESVWWKWVAPGNGQATIQGDFLQPWPDHLALTLYEGTDLNDLRRVEPMDANVMRRRWWEVKEGAIYHLAFESSQPTMPGMVNVQGFAFGMRFYAQPGNDVFAERKLLTGERLSVNGHGVLATREFGEPLHAGKYGGRSVWYEWQAPKDGLATLRSWPNVLLGSFGSGLLTVYTGSNMQDLVSVGWAFAEQVTNEVSFEAVAGEVYVIAVDSEHLPQEFTLELELEPMPMVLSAAIYGRERIVVRVDGAPGSVVIEASVDLEVWEEVARVEAGGPGEVLVHYGVAPQLFLRARAE